MNRNELLDKNLIVNLDFSKMELIQKKVGNDQIAYYNIPAGYDIETSSFYNEHGQKTAITYAHAFIIDGYAFKVETWSDIKIAFDYIAKIAQTNPYKRLIVYIHNLAYEFQFMKKHFNFIKVFNNGGDRSVLTALTSHGIEFRCSLALSGYKLEKTAKNLIKHKIKKMEGDLDYDLIRTPITPLTQEEEGYILNDVVIIDHYIREAMEQAGGDITKIPLTKTGYVRIHTRENTIKGNNKQAKHYRKLIKSLKLTPEEYTAARNAFAGGYTHAYAGTAFQTLEDVTARDLASSYPGVMIGFKYPMSEGEEYVVKNKADFREQLEKYCCLFYIEMTGLVCRVNDGYISASKPEKKAGVTVNNGRIDTAKMVKMWITDVDFEMIKLGYHVDDYRVLKMYRYKPGYLPTSLINVVVDLYKKKTTLKGVKGMEEEYNRSKEMLNSLFGMCVTDIVKEEFTWNDVQKLSDKTPGNVEESIEKYNKSRNRFLSYLWGVWITAYGRYMTFPEVVRLGKDYAYTDTDSIYYTNDAKNKGVFERANRRTETRLKRACEHHGIDYIELTPKSPDGRERPIGAWDLDGEYTRFKTLGAKRYMVEYIDEETGDKIINITVAGVNKSVAVPYLLETYGEDGIFEVFDGDLEIPTGKCGKKTHSYIDETRRGVVVDYNGVPYEYEELSGVHLEDGKYDFSISNEFREFVESFNEIK